MPTIAELRERLNNLAGGNKKKSNEKSKFMWKPSDEHNIRCVPQPDGSPAIKELNLHYNINKGPIVCPKNFGDECSICDFAAKLYSWKDENGNDKPPGTKQKDWEMFRKIQAAPKWYVAVLEREHEAEGVRYWAMTKRVVDELVKLCTNEDLNADREDGGEEKILTSPTNAYDLHISFKKSANADGKGNLTDYPLTEVEERKKPSPLNKDQKEADRILKSVPSIDQAVERVSSKEVHQMFMAFINGGSGSNVSADRSKDDVEYGGSSEKKTEKPVAKANNAEKLVGKKSIDEAFDDLVNEGK